MLYILSKYKEKILYEYEKYQEMHNIFWTKLYQNYPNVILEGKYEPSDATTSQDVYVLSKNYFKDLSYPERDYSITTLDINYLVQMDSNNNLIPYLSNYENLELKIGMAIALNTKDLYEGYDDVKKTLSQFLFITDISYSLRSDDNINLTVNSIKYQDKTIKRLIKLIK